MKSSSLIAHSRYDDERHADIPAIALQSHARFLAYTRRAVSCRSDADDVVQDSYARVIRNAIAFRERDALDRWFFGVLRSALVDHFRKEPRRRRFDTAIRPVDCEPGADVESPICSCFQASFSALRPTYAQLIRNIDLDGRSVNAMTTRIGTTPNDERRQMHGLLMVRCICFPCIQKSVSLEHTRFDEASQTFKMIRKSMTTRPKSPSNSSTAGVGTTPLPRESYDRV